jgi:hypothetical protein
VAGETVGQQQNCCTQGWSQQDKMCDRVKICKKPIEAWEVNGIQHVTK